MAQSRPDPLMPADLPAEMRDTSTTNRPIRGLGLTDTEMPPAAAPSVSTAEPVQRLWDRIQAGDGFWTAVQQPFKARELTRVELTALIDRGLRETRGSYRSLLRVFHLAPTSTSAFTRFSINSRTADDPLARSHDPGDDQSKVLPFQA